MPKFMIYALHLLSVLILPPYMVLALYFGFKTIFHLRFYLKETA